MSANQLIGFIFMMSGISLTLNIGLAGLGLVCVGFMYMMIQD